MYSFDSRIRYSETDIDNYLTIESLIDYFQDCSTFQTQQGPATMEVMAKRGVAWVINSWQVVIKRLPKLGERVTVGTVPYALRGFIGERNFYMDTDEGERIAIANSLWSLINLEKGSPQRIDDDIIATYALDDRLEMNYEPRKVNEPDGADVYDAGEKKVGLHHLDSNHHVNNGQHIRMALQALAKVAEENEIKDIEELAGSRDNIQIRAEYRQQARLGDLVFPRVYVKRKEDESLEVCTVFLNDTAGKPYSIVELKRSYTD